MSEKGGDLPATSFADLTVELRMAAQREAFGLEQMDMLLLHTRPGALLHAQEEVRTTAERLGHAYLVMKALIPFEADIRAMLKARKDAAE